MKTLTAIYRTERNGTVKHMVSEYKTKKAFKDDLKGNGLRTIAILTNEEIMKMKDSCQTFDTDIVHEYVRQVILELY